MQLFISKVMQKILAPVSVRYLDDIDKARQMLAQDLYEYILDECNNNNQVSPINKGTIIFGTPGCSHNVRDGNHCGCSFCDWNDSYVVNPAYAVVLREKSTELYQKMQSKTLEILRGSLIRSELFEEYAIHDCFDSRQIANEEIEALISDSHFEKFPIVGLVQVRAGNVTEEKINLWKKGVKRFLTLGMGVETGNEWIRNHWLNKNLTDKNIETAINIAHSNQCKISANLLMMLPGLTLKQSLSLLMESIIKLVDMDCDSVMLSPLVNRRYTLQGVLGQQSNESQDLFYLIYVIDCISRLDNIYRDKIMLSNVNFSDYINEKNQDDESIIIHFAPLLDSGGMKDFSAFIQKIKSHIDNNSYTEFIDYFDTLSGIESLRGQLEMSAHLASSQLFDSDESYILDKQFSDELELLWV